MIGNDDMGEKREERARETAERERERKSEGERDT